ncbi:MAG: YfjI family protein [Porticoccaceae bacterium]|nr:YfjI family protein [Porticoccaceae bacterium]
MNNVLILPQVTDNPFGRVRFHIAKRAADEVENNIKSPDGMSLYCALSAASLATQKLVKIKLPHGAIVPVSTQTVCGGNSGDRKSATANKFFSEFDEFEKELRRSYENELVTFLRDQKKWQKKQSLLERARERCANQRQDLTKSEWDLAEHALLKPSEPKVFRILYQDTTTAGLFQGIYKNSSSAGLISLEGSELLATNKAYADYPKQNQAWDGQTIRFDRANGQTILLDDIYLSVLMMIQPDWFFSFLQKKGGDIRAVGLCARWILWFPPSKQGARRVNNFTLSWQHLDMFNERIRELLVENVEAELDPDFKPEVLEFSPDAEELYIHYYNRIEDQQLPGGIYFELADHASKLAENAARVAGAMHKFEGYHGQVDWQTLQSAIDIVDAASAHFRGIFTPIPQEKQDSWSLDEWLDRFRMPGHRYYRDVERSYMQNSGPSGVRQKARLDPALDELMRNGRVALFVAPNYKGNLAQWVDTMPWLPR